MFLGTCIQEDDIACVESLIDKTNALRQNLGYEQKDARSVALDGLAAQAVTARQLLTLLYLWGRPDQDLRDGISSILGLTTNTLNEVTKNGDRLHRFCKLSLVTLAQFQIENGLKNVLRELQDKPPPKGFHNIGETILNRLNLSGDLLPVLMVPAHIRNSLHGNGIHSGHKGESSIVKINRIPFAFLHEKKVSCATM